MISQLSPQTFDLCFVCIVGVASVIGILSGMSRILLSCGSWIGAVAAVVLAFSPVHTYAKTFISNDLLAGIAAGASVFIVSFSVLVFVSNSVSGFIRSSALGSIDRALGLLTGAVLGVAVMCGAGIFAPFIFQEELQKDLTAQSKFFSYLELGSDMIKTQSREMLLQLFPESSSALPGSTLKSPSPLSLEGHRQDKTQRHRKKAEDPNRPMHRGQTVSSEAPKVQSSTNARQDFEKLASPPVAKKQRAAKDEQGYSQTDRKDLNEFYEED